MGRLPLLVVFLLAGQFLDADGPAQSSDRKRVIQPPGYKPTPSPLSPGILVGDTLYLSGSTGGDPVTGQLVKGGFDPEMRQIMSNVQTVLAAADMTLSDVVSVTAYLAEMSDFALYLTPSLVNLEAARRATLTMPSHLQQMLPEVVAGDPTATLVFLAEGLNAKATGKNTSTREMSDTGTWGMRDPREATAEAGRRETENFVQAAVKFIERWQQLRPMNR